MHGGVSDVRSNPTQISSPDLQPQQPSGAVQTGAQVEQALGGTPTTPAAARQSGSQTVQTATVASLRGTNAQGAPVRADRTRQAQVMARAELPPKIGVTIPPAARPVNLDSRVLSSEILSLPKGERAGAIARAGQTLQARVNNGFKVFQDIQAGQAHTPATTTDIRDLMTFLTAKSAQKTSYFRQGAFNLPDPGNKIRNFLDSCQEVYQRSSTHIQGFSDHPGCGHRGIDIKLPHGMGTLLYGGMRDGVMDTKGDRLFLKMESHGCRFSTLTQSKVDTQGPQSRPKRFFSDLWTSIKHGWGGLKTKLGLQKTDGTRKERVDKGVVRDYDALVKMAKDAGVPGMAEVLGQGNPTAKETGYGVRTMMDNIDTLLHIDEVPDEARESLGIDQPVPDGLKTAMEAFKQKMEGKYDHLEHRIGNEIVFDMAELQGTDDAHGRVRDGQARTLVSQLAATKSAEEMSVDDTKQMLSTMYALASGIDGEGKDDRVLQKEAALERALSGLSTEQKDHIKTLLTSDKLQDLVNELMSMAMGAEFHVPGHRLSLDQEMSVRGLMADAMETMMFLNQALGGELRMDGEFDHPQLPDLMEDILTEAREMSAGHIKEMVQDHIQSHTIDERSALEIQELAGGEGRTAIGTRAEALFPQGAPRMNPADLNSRTLAVAQQMLTSGLRPATEGLAGEIGLTEQFMKDFVRNGVWVNGTHYGSSHDDAELQRFVDAVGGPEHAKTLSKLLNQDGDKIAELVHFSNISDDGTEDLDAPRTDAQMGLFEAYTKVIMQMEGRTSSTLDTGGRRSVTIEPDGSATIRLSHNKGNLSQVCQHMEVGIRLSGLGPDATVTDAQSAMIFSSND